MKTVFETATARQRIALLEDGEHFALTLNGSLQFHSGDEAPLHELLTSLPLCLAKAPKKVLVLGGGIGLTAREVLRFAEVERLVLVEIDAGLVEVTSQVPKLRALNCDAFSDPRVDLIVGDAFAFAESATETFDLIINAVDISFTPQDREISEAQIRRLWDEESHLLTESGWLSDCINDVELEEYFGADVNCALREFPLALGDRFSQRLTAYFSGRQVGEHVFAWATLESQAPRRRRSVPGGCRYLNDVLVDRFLKRGFLPGQRTH